MSDKIRFGIIGGGMAGPLNAGALRDIPEAEVVAFCDVKEDVAKKFSEEYGIPSLYGDNVFEKRGIRRDRTGGSGKGRYLQGKTGIL